VDPSIEIRSGHPSSLASASSRHAFCTGEAPRHVHGALGPAWLYRGFRRLTGSWAGLIGASRPIFVVNPRAPRTTSARPSSRTSPQLARAHVHKGGIYTGTGLFPVDLWLVFLVGLPVTYLATRLRPVATPGSRRRSSSSAPGNPGRHGRSFHSDGIGELPLLNYPSLKSTNQPCLSSNR